MTMARETARAAYAFIVAVTVHDGRALIVREGPVQGLVAWAVVAGGWVAPFMRD